MTTPDLDALEAVGKAATDLNERLAAREFIATARNNWDWLIAQARAVERVRELHYESACDEDCCGAQPCCADCGPGFGWPCPTIRALAPQDSGAE